MRYEITIDGTTELVSVEKRNDGKYEVAWGQERHLVDLQKPSPEAFQMLIDGESWEVGCVPQPDGYLVDVVGVSQAVQVVDPRRKSLKLGGGAGGGMITTQMPGRVIRALVAVGDTVKKGQPVLVIEAMKMENELKSPIDGVVAEILVKDGQTVEANTKLIRIET